MPTADNRNKKKEDNNPQCNNEAFNFPFLISIR